MNIIVNGENKVIDEDKLDLTYEEIVYLAFGRDFPSTVFTIVYQGKWKGDSRRSGCIYPGKRLVVDEGMIISVAHTGNA